MKLSDHQANFLGSIHMLIGWALDNRLKLTAGEFYRAQWVQDRHVQAGRSWTRNSRHTQRLAADFNLFDGGIWGAGTVNSESSYLGGTYRTATEAYRELGRYWESLSPYNVWAVRLKDGTLTDGNHFERRTTKRKQTRDEEDAEIRSRRTA